MFMIISNIGDDNIMPNIFKNENRDRVKEEMYKIGFKLIKKYGIKKTCVEDITKATGIAKGTFYTKLSYIIDKK